VDLIAKKQHGNIHITTEEINLLIEGFTTGEIPDYPNECYGYAFISRM